MRGFLTRSSDDGLDNVVYVAKHVVIPEAQNEIAISFEIGRSFCVFNTPLNVLPAVKLNNQTRRLTTEIDDI